MSPYTDPLVSIVVTTWNGERHLEQQLASLVDQSHRSLEIIVCDDASTDATRSIVEAFRKRDERVVLMESETNLGLHRNLERGLRRARGAFLAVCDQDDVWHAHKLSSLLGCIDGALVAFSDSALIDSDGEPLGSTLFGSQEIEAAESSWSTVSLIFQNVVSGHALLFDRTLLDYVVPLSDDVLFDHQIALVASVLGGIRFHPTPLVSHRIHGGNVLHHSLMGERGGGAPARKRSKLEDRRMRLQSIRDRMEYVVERCGGSRPDGASISPAQPLLRQLAPIARELRRFDRSVFNAKLFLLLLLLGRRNPSCRYLRPARCLKLSLGARWYERPRALPLSADRSERGRGR